MKNLKKSLVLGGLVIVSAAIAGYRTYELNKRRTEVIEVEVETIKDSQDK